jgi:hypothetical protein
LADVRQDHVAAADKDEVVDYRRRHRKIAHRKRFHTTSCLLPFQMFFLCEGSRFWPVVSSRRITASRFPRRFN